MKIKKYVPRDYYCLFKAVVYLVISSYGLSTICYILKKDIKPFIFISALLTIFLLLYYFNKNIKIKRILNEINIKYNFEFANTGRALFKYRYNKNTIEFEVYHIFNNDNDTKLMVKEIVQIFSNKLKVNYYLSSYKILDNKLIIEITNLSEKRIVLNNIEKNIENDIIQLSQRYFWNMNLATHLILVGSTGTGKTNFQKYLIIQFLNMSNKNDFYLIDGKEGYMYYSYHNYYNQENCAYNTITSIKLLTNLNQIMNNRLIKLNKNKEYIEDMNYIEKFTDEGSILLVIDEALTLVTTMQNEDKELKSTERNYNKFISLLSNLINKGRQANIHVLISGQSIPASVIPTDIRDSLGIRIALGRITRSQSIEIFSTYDVPETDKAYSGVIWHDGMGWKEPQVFLQPYFDESKINFRKILEEIANNRIKSNAICGEAKESQLT